MPQNDILEKIKQESVTESLQNLFEEVRQSRWCCTASSTFARIDNICDSDSEDDEGYIKVAIILAYMRDRAGGCGSREMFYFIYIYYLAKVLCHNGYYFSKYLVNKLVATLINRYGRYDDIFELVAAANDFCDVQEDTANAYRAKVLIDFLYNYAYNVMQNDLKSEQPSLLGKWLPSINTSSSRTRAIAKEFIDWINSSKQKMRVSEYRKICVSLRKKLDIVEHHITDKEYNSIDYAKVPVLALKKYKKAWLRNDKKRYRAYISATETNKKTKSTKVTNLEDVLNSDKYKPIRDLFELCKKY